MNKIQISCGELYLQAELNQSPTAAKIWESLPLEGRANRWGDEIYFRITVQMEIEPEAREIVEVGELGYWPNGPAFCIFFGSTPASTDERPRAYSPVNIFGKVTGDATCLQTIQSDTPIRVEKLES